MSQPVLPLEVPPQEVKRRLDSGEKLALIDVREPSEFAHARIENAELVPMRTVPAELSRLDARTDAGTLIVFCHHGVRSLNVVNWLREQGVDACQSMAGGIDRWSIEIDPSVPRSLIPETFRARFATTPWRCGSRSCWSESLALGFSRSLARPRMVPSYTAAGIVNAADNETDPLAANTFASLYGVRLSYVTAAISPE